MSIMRKGKKMKKLIISLSIFAAAAIAATAIVIVRNNASADESSAVVSELNVGKYYLSGGTDDQYIEVYPDETICMYGYDGITSDIMPLFESRNSYVIDNNVNFIGLDDGENPPVIGYTYSGSNVILFSDYGVEKQYIFREKNAETRIEDIITSETLPEMEVEDFPTREVPIETAE